MEFLTPIEANFESYTMALNIVDYMIIAIVVFVLLILAILFWRVYREFKKGMKPDSDE